MSKETPDTTNLPLNESSQSMQTSMDQFSSFLSAPVRKLDADEYTANDLDGVTESATGSGNLNFLMMQAGQTNEEMRNLSPFDNVGGGDVFGGGLPGFGGNGPLPGSGNGGETAMDRAFDPANEYDSGLAGLNSGGSLNSTAGSLGAVAAAHTAATPFSDISNISFSDIQPVNNGNNGNNGNGGTNGINGISGDNGTSGTNGSDGIDGGPGEGTTIINNVTNINEGDLTEIVNELPFDLGPIGISLDATLDDLTNLTLDIINGDTITNVLNEAVDIAPVLGPVEDLVGNILSDVSLDAILDPFQYDGSADDFDLNLESGLNLLGIDLPGIGIDIPLDPLERLVGDIDIGLGLANNALDVPILGDLLGDGTSDLDLGVAGLESIIDTSFVNDAVQTIMNPVENLIGDIDIGSGIGLGLLGADLNEGGTDTDITIPLDIALIDNNLLGETIGISLDPLESIVGDIDLDLGAGINLLGNIAPSMFDSEAGGTGTDDLLSQVGDNLSGLVEDANLPIGEIDVPLDLENIALPELPALAELPGLPDTSGIIDSLGDIGPGGDPTDILGGLGSLLDVIDTVVSEVDGAIDLLDSLPVNTGGLDLGALTDGLGGGGADGMTSSATTTWTETLLPNVGDILGGGLAGDPTSIIPDPIASVPSISLPVIPVLPIAPPVLGGGLFGGGGGLFG